MSQEIPAKTNSDRTLFLVAALGIALIGSILLVILSLLVHLIMLAS